MQRFPNDRIGVMRHGETEHSPGEHREILTLDAQRTCCRSVSRLLESLEQEVHCASVLVLYSSTERAQATAQFVAESTKKKLFDLQEIIPSVHLNSGNKLDDELLYRIQSPDQKTFTLLITHLDVIGNYLGFDKERWARLITPGRIFCNNF